MEEIMTCEICVQQFDSLHFIPKILECGHTFCSPCLTKLFQNNPICPNCRTKIKGIESSIPVNFIVLKVVEAFKSKRSSEREENIITSIEDMKKKFNDRKDIISKKKTQMTSSLEVLDRCLAKLEELTVSEGQKVDTVNARKRLNEVDEELKKTDVVSCDDAKRSESIRLSNFEDTASYLMEVTFHFC
ncbi:UNVERIFIED_CONTAM: hypothetical protein RMT77_019677 [Armadillidium vulgare]